MRILSLIIGIAVAGMGILSCQSADESAIGAELTHDETKKTINVEINGDPFTVYHYNDTLRKPVFFPVFTAEGVLVTRGFPMEPRASERIDHPHQTGLWFNFGDVNGVDFWNNSYARPKEELHRYGKIRQTGLEITSSQGDTAAFIARAEWVDHEGNVLLSETARYFFTGSPGKRIVERRTKLTAMQDTVILRDNKEGLFALRVARAFESPSRDSLILTNSDGKPSEKPVLDNEGVNGHYRGSNGLEGADQVWGTPNKWITLSAVADGDSVTLAIFDHPDNPGFPAYWHARDYGLFSANNLGRQAYNPDLDPRIFRLSRGESLNFRHLLLINSGGFLSPDEVEKEFEQFVREE